MICKKINFDEIKRCYCVSSIEIDGDIFVLFASECPEKKCYAYFGDNFEKKEVVWEDRSGCMSIVPFEKREGEFLTINEFDLKANPSTAKLVWGKRVAGKWITKDVISLPFLHRFDIYHIEGKDYFIGATIAEKKECKNDWTKPGHIYIGEIGESPIQEIRLKRIEGSYFKNHGYTRGNMNGLVCGYFASDDGIIRVTPSKDINNWKIEKILDGNFSEIALSDIDDDGIEEMITIEPFHGNKIKIYKLINGEYKKVYTYSNDIDFAHALVSAEVCKKKCFIIGVRRKDCELAMVTFENGEYKEKIIEKGVGPANIAVVSQNGKDYILSANHTKDEAAIYECENAL